jgi:RNA polymerase sigma factor (sigma-70 family)
VVGASAPEADATRALYEQYAKQIFRYCLHQLGSREEAEDAVQSTFLNAFRGLKRGVVPELESAWLFKIAHNVCLSRRRSSWRRGRVESPHDFEVIEEFAPAPTRQGEELIGLQDVLEGMPENQRRAILLREWQGLSYREIADELELSQAAVETLIFRARRSLAQGLQQAPVEQRSWRARLRSILDLGGAVGAFQGWLAGGAAVKVTAAVVAVTATTVAASTPDRHHGRPAAHSSKAAPAVKHRASTQRSTRVSTAAPLAAPAAARDVHAAVHRPVIHTFVRRTHAAKPVRVSTPPPAPAAQPPAANAPPVDTAPPPAAPPVQQAPPVQTPAPAPQADSHPSPPATPPGQAKKDDPPAQPSKGHSSDPPGQAKKDDPAPPAASTPPGHDQGGQGDNGNGHDNKGQDKKDLRQQAVSPPAVPVAPQPTQPTPPSVDPVATQSAPAAPVTTPPAPVASTPPADDGNGNGHGGGNGHGQGHHP